MHPGKRCQTGVSDGVSHFDSTQGGDPIGAAMLGELSQDLMLGLRGRRDIRTTFRCPEAGLLGRVHPARPGTIGDALYEVRLAGEAGVTEVLDRGTDGAVIAVDDADGPTLLVSQECGGKADDAGADDKKVGVITHSTIV